MRVPLCLVLLGAANALVDFPQLPALVLQRPALYDGTTCANLFCRQAAVFKNPSSDPACASDWTACAVPDPGSQLPACGTLAAQSPWIRCRVWVPCDDNKRLDGIVASCVVAVVLIVSVALHVFLGRIKPTLTFRHALFAMQWLAMIIVSFMVAISVSDFYDWKQATEANLSGLDPTAWQAIQEIYVFMPVHLLLLWVGSFLLVHFHALKDGRPWVETAEYVLKVLLVVMHLACFIASVVYLCSAAIPSSTQVDPSSTAAIAASYAATIDGYTGQHVPVFANLGILMVLDFYSICIWLWVTFVHDEEPKKTDDQGKIHSLFRSQDSRKHLIWNALKTTDI